MAEISFAQREDLPELMEFMNKCWRQGHILSKNPELFLHEFWEEKKLRLNLAIAKYDKQELIGLFGFIPYSSAEFPDIAGSLWKVDEKRSDEPMLGLKLRNFVIENVPHRFCAAPGAGLQTKEIYKFLKMDWFRMPHYYLRNPQYEVRIGVFVETARELFLPVLVAEVQQLTAEELTDFPYKSFSSIAPLKDANYMKKRYIDYPYYDYRLLRFSHEEETCLVVYRFQEAEGGKILRIVDFLGEEKLIPQVTAYLYQLIQKESCEYADFIIEGIDYNLMNEFGWNLVDFDSNEVIVPNHFGPFVRKNVPIYCVADRNSKLKFRQCKADGDQDRPSC